MPESQNKQNDMSVDVAQKMSHIEDKVNDLSNEVKEMGNQIKEIYTSIVGDKKFGHEGLVQRVQRLEDSKKNWERKMNWFYGYVFGAGTIMAGVFEVIKSIMK